MKMNVPPECDFANGHPALCSNQIGPVKTDHLWSVLNKKEGKHFTVCLRHIHLVLKPGSTLVLCPAKDYSKKD